jgi:hypothetical protein
MLFFGLFLDRFREAFWLVLGSAFWKFWVKRSPKSRQKSCGNVHRQKASWKKGWPQERILGRYQGGVPPLRPGKPSPGCPAVLRQCTRASLGIVFASFLDFLHISVNFWIDWKNHKKHRIRGPPKTTQNLNNPPQWCPMCQLSWICHDIWTSIFHRISWPRETS